MKDDRLYRVIVLGGLGLVCVSASLAGCKAEPARGGQHEPPEYEPPRAGPASPDKAAAPPEPSGVPSSAPSAQAPP